MNKKFFVSLAIILFSIFSFSICLANDGKSGMGTAANDVRNFVGGVEDTVENAARDVSNTSKGVTGGVENDMNRNYASGMTNSNGMIGSNRNSNYTATRTSTNMGMSQNTWIWLIIGVAAIAIIAVVWYYSMQFTNGRRNNNDKDDE